MPSVSHIFRFFPARLALIAYVSFFLVSLLTRLMLLFAARHHVDWDLSLPGALGAGVGVDLIAAIFATLPWILLGSLLPLDWLRSRAGGMLVTGGMAVFVSILIFITTAEWFFWDEFSVRFNFIAVDYLVFTTEVLGNIKQSYPMGWILSGLGLLASLIVWGMHRLGLIRWAMAGTASWPERYAWPVGVLILTAPSVLQYLDFSKMVWPHLQKPWVIAAITGAALGMVLLAVWGQRRHDLFRRGRITAALRQAHWRWPIICLAVALVPVLVVKQAALPAFTNPYHGELAKNGPWSFFAAYWQMELDYGKWYVNLPEAEMLAEAKRLLATSDEPCASAPDDLSRSIKGRGPERRLNVILVCMESLSGDYMSYLGNGEKITPNLDKLAKESLFLDNHYATGTRTVRGMEALTLCLPPTPGQAIIRRPEGTYLRTSFTPFLDRGYDCAFFYGGEGYFDDMNRYFETAGCRIMDATKWHESDVTFKTTWGACDEDMFNKVLGEADADFAAGRKFDFFCMTTSNHRPYDFPAGRIDLPSHTGGRNAAVKYSDWAIGDLVAKAATKPWFKDTLLVFVSDHCSSSAGKTELDVTKYHIPAMIYNPGLVPAAVNSTLCSQIDIMPTVFGLLHWNYQTLAYGHDLLDPAADGQPGRAFVSNYQKIALLRDSAIGILKPRQATSAFTCDRTTGALSPLAPAQGDVLVHDATVFYQSASWLFSTGRLKHNPAAAPAASGAKGER